MARREILAAAAAIVLICAGGAQAAPASPGAGMPAPIVFFDIAGTDIASQAAFYKAVFDWDAAPDGRLTVPVASPLPGNLRLEAANQGPVAERVLYIGVPDINAALETIKAHGGSVVFGRMAVPGVVIVALFKDPAGNRMGLVEMSGGKPIVPPAK